MTLRIRRLTTAVTAGPRQVDLHSQVDGYFRDRMPSELAAHLGPALDREAPVVRIRRLHLRVKLRASDIRSHKLSSLWMKCFCTALFRLLAYPDEMMPSELRRYSSRGGYLASLAATFLRTPESSDNWLAKDASLIFHTPVEMARRLATEEPEQLAPMLRELHRLGLLQAFLATLDELALEEIMQAVGRSTSAGGGAETSTAIVLTCAKEFALSIRERRQPRQWKMDSRRSAIWLWSTFPSPSRTPTPQRLWLALQALGALIRDPSQLETGLVAPHLHCSEAAQTILKECLRDIARGSQGTLDTQELLAAMRTIAPIQMSSSLLESKWILSDVAGILLFMDQISRLGWDRFLSPEAFPFVTAAIAAELTGPRYQFDPAVFLLAGFPEAFDQQRAEDYFAYNQPPATALGVDRGIWKEVLASAASLLALSFAQRIRGFRKASLPAIKRNIVTRAGRYRVEPERVVVVLETGPWDAALHLSGVDSDLDSVAWLGGRRVEFILEGT